MCCSLGVNLKRSVDLGAVVVLLTAAPSAGCNTPTSICQDHRDAFNKAYARCGIPVVLPADWLTWSSGPCDGLPASCDDLTKVTDASKILNDCIPALEAIGCDTLSAALEEPAACHASVYAYPVVSQDHYPWFRAGNARVLSC